ncbi:Serine/threonine-protein phosphatase 4 regulatory subunit 4, partial [Quaeritorhiza haematococci]
MAERIDWETALGITAESLEVDIYGTDEVKLSHRLFKTEEEIEKFTVDESLDDVERAAHLLRHGAYIQKTSMISSFPKLLRENNTRTRTLVFPILLEMVPTEPPDIQIQIGRKLLKVLRHPSSTTKSMPSLSASSSSWLAMDDDDGSDGYLSGYDSEDDEMGWLSKFNSYGILDDDLKRERTKSNMSFSTAAGGRSGDPGSGLLSPENVAGILPVANKLIDSKCVGKTL